MRTFTSLLVVLGLISWVGCPGTGEQGEVSDCGGFDDTAEFAITEHGHDELRGYCDAEVLYWEYDAVDGRLTVLDSRVMLNCCGEHSVSISGVDTITILEQDEPESGNSRCDCVCAFDFRADLEGLVAGPVDVELLLHVTDVTDDPTDIWTGTLDLREGSGEIVLDATPEPYFCE